MGSRHDVLFWVFFSSLLGLEESCICQPSPMVSGISDPAVAFPVEDMQQAERAGSLIAPSAGFSMAPSELPALPLERGENCAPGAGRPLCQPAL